MSEDADRESWAWEKDHGFDAEGHQRKEACLAIAACPECGKDVELVADTESWTEDDEGRWVHDSYGPAAGCCCGKLIADWFEGCFAFSLADSDECPERDDDDDDFYEDDCE